MLERGRCNIGIYFNPDNGSFVSDKNSKIYIDKTGLLDFLNDVIGTNGKCIASFRKHLNKYNVIHLDISSFWDSYKENIIEKIVEYIFKDFQLVFGEQLDYEDNQWL